MVDLKPCPFCGSNDAELHPDYPMYVKCGCCDAQGPPANGFNTAKAIKLWNTRFVTDDDKEAIQMDMLMLDVKRKPPP